MPKKRRIVQSEDLPALSQDRAGWWFYAFQCLLVHAWSSPFGMPKEPLDCLSR